MERVEDELKSLILERYKSLREFSIKIGMPYSTLDSVLKRGIMKSSVSSAILICNELSIDAEALAKGTIIERTDTENYEPNTIAAHHDGDWTKDELEEIEKFKEFVKMRRIQKDS